MEHETNKPELEIWAKAAELRELLKQLPPRTPKSPEIESLEEALAKLERIAALNQNR